MATKCEFTTKTKENGLLFSVNGSKELGSELVAFSILMLRTVMKKKPVLNPFPNKPLFLRVCCTSLENTVGKGEIAHNKQFLLFPQCFLPILRTFCHFYQM